MFAERPALDLFADPSGKAVGRLFMARDGIDLIGRENIVYVDLGAEDNVQVRRSSDDLSPSRQGKYL